AGRDRRGNPGRAHCRPPRPGSPSPGFRESPRAVSRAPSRLPRAAAGLLLVLAAAPASAATWWRLPIWGADIRVFASDPFQPGSVFCGTSRGNFYGSSDGGASWAPLRQGPAFPGYVVTGLVADPRTPGRLWASLAGQYAGGLVVRSDNRGADWTILGLWKQTV